MTKNLFLIASPILAAILVFIVSLTFSGCVGVEFSGVGAVLGEGSTVAREYDAPGYTAVEVRGEFAVEYSSIPSDKVTLEAREDLMPHLSVTMEGDKLIVDNTEMPVAAGNNGMPILRLSTPDLKELHIMGVATMDEADTIKGDSFTLSITGVGDLELPLEVEKLDVNVGGVGDIVLRGTAANADIRAAGVISLNASELKTKNTVVNIPGMGDVSIDCSDTLAVDIVGAGSLEYRGDPTITRSNLGLGSISKAG